MGKLKLKKELDCPWCGTRLKYINQCKCKGTPEKHGRCTKCGALIMPNDLGRFE